MDKYCSYLYDVAFASDALVEYTHSGSNGSDLLSWCDSKQNYQHIHRKHAFLGLISCSINPL